MQSMDMVIKGSFVIAAICQDGIIIASESRANIFDKAGKKQEPIAYYDTEQKVFPLGNCAIAQTGQGLILNVFFSAVVKQISNSPVIPHVEHILPALLDHCRRSFPVEFVNEIRKQKLFAAGYTGNHPTICYFNEAQTPPFDCIQDHGYIQSAPTILRNHNPSNLSAEEAADLAERAIQAYAEEDDRWKTIGGPVSVLLITQDGCQWIKNTPSEQKWTYIQDFVRDYRSGKVEINPIPPATRGQLDKLLSTVTNV